MDRRFAAVAGSSPVAIEAGDENWERIFRASDA
jgi:hypothetical protein